MRFEDTVKVDRADHVLSRDHRETDLDIHTHGHGASTTTTQELIQHDEYYYDEEHHQSVRITQIEASKHRKSRPKMMSRVNTWTKKAAKTTTKHVKNKANHKKAVTVGKKSFKYGYEFHADMQKYMPPPAKGFKKLFKKLFKKAKPGQNLAIAAMKVARDRLVS